MLAKYAELIQYMIVSMPVALGEFMPLLGAGAALFLSYIVIRRISRGL